MSSFFPHLFERILPPPRFLTLTGGGLEVSEHSIKHFSLAPVPGKETFTVGAFGSSEVGEGIIVGGEIKDLDRLVTLLRPLRQTIGNSLVHVSLPEQKGYLFQVTFPRSPDLNVMESLAFTLEEHVPLAPEEAVFDCEVLPSESNENTVAVVVTAFPRRTIETYSEALRRSGFTPLSFEIESQAAARALIAEGDEKTYMVVDFGETRTAISIIDRGHVRFTTSLEIAGASLSAAFKKELNVTAQEIERLKNEEGIAHVSEGGKVGEILLTTISALRDEIGRHFVFWHTHREAGEKPHRPIEAVILTGGNANLLGLPEYIEQTMNVKALSANVWGNVCDLSTYVPPITRSQSFRYGTVIGLALRGHMKNL